MQSLAAVIGCDSDGAPKRQVLFGNYVEPRLPYPARMKWLRKLSVASSPNAKPNGESFPHKAEPVARAIAELGDVCKASIEFISKKAGCVETTVKAVEKWLEERGALTWSNTRGKDKGRMVRTWNLYTLILDFAGATATIARTMRAIWRERPRVFSKGNGCPGVLEQDTYTDPYGAMRRLAEIRKEREAVLSDRWKARHTT